MPGTIRLAGWTLTDWRGPPGTMHRAVRGHVYGLNLPAASGPAKVLLRAIRNDPRNVLKTLAR